MCRAAAICIGLQSVSFPNGCMKMFSRGREVDISGKSERREGCCVCEWKQKVCTVYIPNRLSVVHHPVLSSPSLSSPCRTHAASAFQWRVTPVTTLLQRSATPLNVCVRACVCVHQFVVFVCIKSAHVVWAAAWI